MDGHSLPLPTAADIQIKDMAVEISHLKDRLTSQEVNLSIISSWSDVLYKGQISLQEQLHHHTARHMQNELVVRGVRQVHCENCKRAAVEFFCNRVGINTNLGDVWHAYCKGSATTKTINGQRIHCLPS